MVEPYEILSHTADVGVRARGATPAEAFENAARGMLSLIVEPGTVRAVEEVRIEVSGADAVDLFVGWLREVLYQVDAHKRVFAEVHVEEWSEWRVVGRLRGEPINRGRHELGMEIKAVTYHGAKVEQTGAGWVVEVLLDI